MSLGQPALELPPEVVDIVIDHLHDDNPSLAACSQTCRSWVPASRYHLFHSIKVTVRSATGEDEIREMLERLESVGSYVRQLHLSTHPSSHKRSFPFSSTHLLSIMSKLPALHTLILDGMHCFMEDPSHRAPERIRKLSLLNLCPLEFDADEFTSPADAMLTFQLFSGAHLEELCVDAGGLDWTHWPGWDEEGGDPTPNFNVVPTLRVNTLRIGAFQITQAFRYILDLSTVRRLEVKRSVMPYNPPELTRSLLSEVGTTLWELEFDYSCLSLLGHMNLPPSMLEPVMDNFFPLSMCQSLQAFYMHTGRNESEAPWRMAQVLLQSAPLTMRRLTFTYPTFSHDPSYTEEEFQKIMAFPCWAELERTILRFPQLETVSFVLEETLSYRSGPNPISGLSQNQQDTICTIFPILHNAGILRFPQWRTKAPFLV